MEMEKKDMKMEVAEDVLEEQLRAHSVHFASMVELIPAKFYISKDDSDPGAAEGARDSKYWVNKRKKKTPKEVVQKAKRMKLDPGTQKSMAQLQAEEVGQEENCKGGQLNGFSVEHVRSSSLSDLQDRLKEKIETFRKNRKVPPESKEGGLSKKISAKRQKKMENRKREKQLRKKNLVSSRGQSAANGDEKRGAMKSSGGDGEDVKRIVFNKFDFSTPVETEVQAKKKTGKRDYRKLLAKAEASQRKLDELKRKDERRGRELERKLQWQKALDMARGTKLKDNPRLLKNTSKRVEKRKQKSKKEWEERKEFEKEAQEKRQEKRKRNIQHRQDQVKERKIKKRTKKGVSRTPGF